MNKKQLFISMTAQIVSFAVSMGVSFILSPYLAKAIDISASGFVTQGNQFVSYAQILVSALNTMASRFITVSIHQGKEEEANRYFSSVFFGNVFMAAVFAVPATFLILFVDQIMNVPAAMVTDLQIMLFFVMLNFVLNIILSVFSVSVYAKDRLDLLAIKTIESEIVRMVLLVGCYTFFRPYMWYVGIGSVVYTLVLGLGNYRYTKRLMPEVHISRKYFDMGKIKELVSLGAWNSVTRLGQTLLEGLDLLIANILIDPGAMGILDFAKKVPLCIVNLMSSVVGIFNPQITILYAEEKYDEMVQMIKSANRIMIFMLSIPIAFVTAFGDIFFSLWLPAYDAHQLHLLCVLSMGTLYVQHEYPGALPHFHHHEKGKGELPGGAAVGISVHGHGVFAAENDEPGAVRHRAVQCLLRMAAKPLVHAAVRQQMSAGKVDDLLRGHPHRREISGVRGAGGPFVPHRVPHPFLDHADRLWLRGRGGGADRQLSHCVKERRACPWWQAL